MRSKKDKRAISRRGGSGAEIPKTHSRAMTDVQISGLSEQKISVSKIPSLENHDVRQKVVNYYKQTRRFDKRIIRHIKASIHAYYKK